MSNKIAIKDHGLGKMFWDASLSQVNLSKDYQNYVLNWLKANKRFLVFAGNPGAGKTYLCAAILNHLISSGQDVRYYTGRTFYQKVRSSIGDRAEYSTTVQHICDVNFLIIDDFGCSQNTEWQKEILFDLVDMRHQSLMPTIFTTNLNKKEITEVYGSRFSSRMFDKNNLFITAWDEDRRTVEKKEKQKSP